MKWYRRWLTLDPTGEGQPGAGAGAGGGAEGKPGEGGAGNQGAPPPAGGTTDLFKLKRGGNEKEYSREAAVNLAQIGLDSQANAQAKEGEYAKRMKGLEVTERQLRAMIAEMEKSGKGVEGEEGTEIEKSVKEMQGKMDTLTKAQGNIDLDRALTPVKAKYKDIDENLVLRTFLNKVDSGEVEDTQENLMKTADEMSKGRGEWFDTSLAELTKNPDDPRMKAYNERLLSEYVSGKRRLANASGETGGAGSGGIKPAEKPKTIAEAASRVRQMPSIPQ